MKGAALRDVGPVARADSRAFCRHAAQLICAALVVTRAEEPACDRPLKLFILVEGVIGAVNAFGFGVAEWYLVSSAEGDYLEAYARPAAPRCAPPCNSSRW